MTEVQLRVIVTSSDALSRCLLDICPYEHMFGVYVLESTVQTSVNTIQTRSTRLRTRTDEENVHDERTEHKEGEESSRFHHL